ncbi:hypothetical protein DIE06_27830 [Burkholderia sp. Bp8998]|nr:hypothetical protein DIE06_27830 [Burkholderia sp. Bp8998]
MAAAAVATWLCATSAHAGWLSSDEKQLTAEADRYVEDKPPELQRILHTLYMEGEWNAVLNLDLLALAALEIHRADVAERALDMANARILRVYAEDPNAAKARSLWSSESVKDFKGEPYERAMSFYYRGLLYLRAGDYQNARAAFRQADLQNSFGQYERYDTNTFPFMQWLSAWAAKCDGNTSDANDTASRATVNATAPFLRSVKGKIPSQLVIFETGMGPEKVTLGDTKSILGFMPQPGRLIPVRMSYEGGNVARIAEGVAADIDSIAMTRGGRPIQGILDGKAMFKENTATLSETAGAVSSGLMQAALSNGGNVSPIVTRNLGAAGAVLSLIGTAAGAVSHAANAEADTRYWASLPKAIYVQAYEGAPRRVPAFPSANGSGARPILLEGRHGACSFVWGREYSALDAANGGVANPSPWPAEPMEANREKANAAFRTELRSLF